jgi:copper chaperone
MQFHIPDMACDGCVRSVTLAIQAVDPGAQVTADLPARRIDVASQTPRDRLATALADIGYAPASTGEL